MGEGAEALSDVALYSLLWCPNWGRCFRCICHLRVIFKQDQPSLWLAVLWLTESSATFVFHASIVLMKASQLGCTGRTRPLHNIEAFSKTSIMRCWNVGFYFNMNISWCICLLLYEWWNRFAIIVVPNDICIKNKDKQEKITLFETIFQSPTDLGLLRKMSDAGGLYGYFLSRVISAFQHPHSCYRFLCHLCCHSERTAIRGEITAETPVSAMGVLKMIKLW